MKIKICVELHVPAEVRPEIGSVHEVVDTKHVANGTMYFIVVPGGLYGARIGAAPGEYEVIEEATT